jgi:nucleotide-binding universal stress UspA family protein
MYREILCPVDNSQCSDWAVDRSIELCRRSGGRITGTHVYAARLHDVRFRQLESGLPAQFQTPDEIKRQRKIHDKLIEKGLQLISDSFLDQVDTRARTAGVPLTRQLLEGINYEELVREANRGEGRLPSLIGFDPNIADKYDGGATVRGDVRLGENGRLIAEDEDADEKLAGTSNRTYDLLAIGAHGIGRQQLSQLGGVVARVLRRVEKDVLIVRDQQPLQNGRLMVCVDGSSYSYKAMRVGLELAREYNATLYVCSAFDVEYHHVVFHNIKDVLSYQASKVFKFEEQEELHNNIIDKGLLKLSQANIKRAQAMAQQFPDVEVKTQILIGKPFQVIMQWAEEIQPSLVLVARHGSHRIDGTDLGSQAENVVRQIPHNVLLIGTTDVRPDEIPWIEEDGRTGLEWEPAAEVRILRVPPFALGIARKAVEEYVMETYGPGGEGFGFGGRGGDSRQNGAGESNGGSTREGAVGSLRAGELGGFGAGAVASLGAVVQGSNGNGAMHSYPGTAAPQLSGSDAPQLSSSQAPQLPSSPAPTPLPVVTNARLDEAIRKLLPTHMQLIMGIGTAEELALAEVKAEEAMKRTVVNGLDADPLPETPMYEAKCPFTGHVTLRERQVTDPVEWTQEAYERLKQVPLIARPLARNTVERFARDHGFWRITTVVMDENKQAMIEADTFDLDTMLVMFKELQAKQLQAAAEGVDGLTPEMRRFIEEAKASGVTRCPIRDIEKAADKCPVDFKMMTPDGARAAVEKFAEQNGHD